MAFGTMTSRVLGQVRESLLAFYFDKQITDAWNAAFRVPNLFRRLLGEGSLSVSFIPVFVDCHLESPQKAQNLVNSVYTFLLLVLGVITAFGIIFPEPVLGWILDPAFVADTEKFQLTVRLAKIMFGFLFFISSYAFMMGILNALGQFALPAMAPTFWNIAMIAFTVAPPQWFAVNGDQLALGVLIGGAAQAGILLPALIKTGYLPKLHLNFSNPDFLKFLRKMAPGLLGTGLLQFTTVINLKFASSFVEGTISYINYVDRLIELPLSLISVSLGTALLPALSGFLARGERTQFAETTRRYLELNLLMTMAAAAGLYTLAQPVVELLFGHGQFKHDSVLATADILKTYCWIMIFSSGVRVVTPAYYATKNTWFPAAVSTFCLAVHIVLAPQLMKYHGVNGLMMSTISSAFLNLTLLLLFYRKYIGEFDYKKFFGNVTVFALVALVTAFAGNIFYVLKPLLPEGKLFLALNLAVSIPAAVGVFVTVGFVFKVKAVRDVADRIVSKIKRKLKK
ncbi:MAG: putative virulence factor [Pseudobdellovibrio sp.]|jgi:putative peptidoglycan lipid II flippase|nr:putative virulence factor [Pseudobdellovibrio sp.]